MKTMKKRWMKSGINYLLDNYGKLSPKECAVYLNRSLDSVKHKAKRLGLAKERRAFTEYEIEYVKTHYAEQGPRPIAKVLNRAAWSVYQLANRRLGLKTNPEFRRNLTIKIHAGRKRPKSTREKLSACGKKRVGDKNSNWRGGITQDATLLGNNVRRQLWPIWTYPILSRDDFTCQHYDSNERIEVHHLKKFINIRDYVMKQNPFLSISIEKDRNKLAKLIVIEHELEDGITLCRICHKTQHSNKLGKLQGTPNISGEGNLQPSLPNLRLVRR